MSFQNISFQRFSKVRIEDTVMGGVVGSMVAASRQFSSEGGIGDKQTQIRGWSILDAEPEGGFRVQGRVFKLVWGLAHISCPIKGRSFQEQRMHR